MAREINYSKILEDTSSFQLVRTNPKLTGNVKFTIDSRDRMWLNSIDVNQELSRDLYKRVPIDPDKSLPANMFKFFAGGTTPSEIVFDLNEAFDPVRTSSDYKDQYDFAEYFSGAKYLPSRRYEEKLTYFAPLYLKRDIPDRFVIFKIEDPLNSPIDEIEAAYPFDRVEYIKEMFSKATLIKTFDISEGTKVGDYIRKYVQSDGFPASSLEVSFQEDQPTNWSGILYDSGVFGKRGENLKDLYSESNPLKYFEEFITLGYERNGVIFPNILNIEFIFDDETSDLYEFNRYVGFYVNEIELSKLDIDLDRAYNERGTWENTPRFRRNIKEYEDIDFEQENPDGVVIPVSGSEVYFSDFENIFQDKDNLFFNYLRDKDGNLYFPKISNAFNIDFDENSNELLSGKIRLSNKSINLGKFFGKSTPFLQDLGVSSSQRGYSTQYIKVSSIEHLDEIKIYHPRGTRSDSNGRYESIVGTIGYAEVTSPGSFYVYNDLDGVAGFDTFYFNAEGLEKEVASAIAGCINGIRNASIKAYVKDDYVFIKSNVAGEYDDTYKIEFSSPNSNYSGVEIDLITGSDLIGNLISFSGGSRESGNRLVIESSHLNKINQNLDSLLVKTESGWSKIKKTSRYQDLITESNLSEKISAENAVSEYFNKIVITLDLDESPDIKFKEFSIFKKHRPSFGFLSFFPIKDFDFDFYSSEYLNFPILDLYKDYYIPPNTAILDHNYTYEVVGDGEIEIDGASYSAGTPIVLAPSTSKYSYSVVSGDPIVSFYQDYTTIGSRLDVPINDQDKELQAFPGFFLLKDPSKVVPEQVGRFFELRDKHLNGITDSEYDYFKENESLDFSLKSKMIPYITKWAATDGLDARSNPYRLNTELAFGFNNLSPDHDDLTQNPQNFTHEWFYVESNFNYLDDQNTVSLNNSYFEEPFDISRALTDSGYFVDYFTYTPTFNGDEISRTQTRYSPIFKNNQGVYEAFFKGFKINFKEFIDPNNVDISGKPVSNPDSEKFEDYRFSSILKVTRGNINDDSTPPIRYRLIEHTDFKFIVLVVELNLEGSELVDDYWKEVTSAGSPPISGVDESNFLTTNPGFSGSTYAFDSINGDYRINFKTVSGIDISDITYTFLYSLKNKKFNNLSGNYSNVKLSGKLNLSTSGAFTAGGNLIESLDNPNFDTYPINLRDEIINPSVKNFILARNISLSADEYIGLAPGLTPDTNSPLVSASNSGVNLSDNSDVFLINDSNFPTFSIPSGLGATYFKNNYIFKILAGGKSTTERLFSKLSFAEFKRRINSLDLFIEYESYSYSDDTGLVQNTDIKWFSEIPDISKISKKDASVPILDDDKPSDVSFQTEIGYRYTKSNLDNSYEINRYDGGFSPLFKNKFDFNSKVNFTNNDIVALDSANVKLNLNIDDFLKIRNFNHIKISNTKILTLESSEAYDPKYERVNEIAIGRSDYDLLMSNWDYGFHYRYPNKSDKVPVAGSLRIEEDNSFISKLVKLRDEIEIEQFNVSVLDNVNRIDPNAVEIAYSEGNQSISGVINIKNALTSFLIQDGITDKFAEFLKNEVKYIGNNDSIETYVKKYIDANISRLYELLSIEFYTLEDKTLSNQNSSNVNSIEFRFLDDQSRNQLGYKRDNNLQINKIDRLLLNFTFAKKLNSGLLVSPKIKIKFI
jgi:hypothetical protein